MSDFGLLALRWGFYYNIACYLAARASLCDGDMAVYVLSFFHAIGDHNFNSVTKQSFSKYRLCLRKKDS